MQDTTNETVLTKALAKLEELCQLHERIHILYVVDLYEATLLTKDGDVPIANGEGTTIEEALIHLAEALADRNLESVRHGHSIVPILYMCCACGGVRANRDFGHQCRCGGTYEEYKRS